MMMRMFQRILFALLSDFTLVLLQVQAQEPGFISIDCGANSSYSAEQTGLNYITDATFIETGISRSISPAYVLDTLKQPLWTLRSFPEGTRNCYNVSVKKGGRYLIRATFLYGNYDALNKVPEFDLYVGPNLWESVILDAESTILFTEIIHVSPSKFIDVCLVNTGSGTPLISSLEFRLLKDTIYVTQSGSLSILARMNAVPITNETLRYPDDAYDRRWISYNPGWEQLTASNSVDVNDFQPPQIVLKTAGTPKNESEPLRIPFGFTDSTSKVYVYMHFAELEVLQANQSRKFNISIGGNHLYGPVAPLYLSTKTVYTPAALSGGNYEVLIYRTEDSTLPPILNAIEFYLVIELPQSETNEVDADAIKNIKSLYKRKDWQGDPCAPQAYMWKGLDCSYNDNDPPRIISLDLSSSGLNGEIPPYISNLTVIQHLDLSNNSLTGLVPEFLSQLPSLKSLNLSGNNLTGSVPIELIERSKSGSLSLSVDENPNLCASASCSSKKKKKKKVVVPVVASFASLFVLMSVLAIFWRLKRPKPAGKVGKYPSNSSKKNRRFTYAELSMITNKFKTVLGEGSFGKVYHGYLDDDTEVAVKILSELSNQGYEQFEAEVKLLQTVHHKNLTTLYGYCDEGNQIGLIYEYMANGNLKEHLSGRSADILSWEGRLRLAVEAAQGLEYLHYGCKPPRVHRDIKSANILLSDKFEAKIADFGLTKTFPVEAVTHVSTAVAGTFGYLDPEYCQTYRLNEKSDVYSFGVVLLEIITSRPVIANSDGNNHISQWVGFMLAQGDIKKIVDPRLRGDFDINSAWKAVEIAMASVSRTSTGRPTMNHVVMELKQCLAMEIARKEGHGTESRDQQEMITLNLNTGISPVAR